MFSRRPAACCLRGLYRKSLAKIPTQQKHLKFVAPSARRIRPSANVSYDCPTNSKRRSAKPSRSGLSPYPLLGTFAGESHCNARHGSEFGDRSASALKRSVPLTTAQERPDNLPRTFVATNAVAAMDANREQAILPTFMDVVAKPDPHSSPAASASLEQEGPEVHGFDARRSRK